MRIVIRTILAIVLVALLPVALHAQDEFAAMQEGQEELDQMFSAVGAFVGDVRFDEGDVRSLIDLWEEWSEFGDEQEDDEEDAVIDFESLLRDSAYRHWAASHSLDADDWMRKTMRISMSLYREEMLAAAALMPAQMAEQLEMIEQQREQLGEELYQQMKNGMAATAEYGKAITDSARHLPEPTAAEQALLDLHRDELAMIIDSGDEEYDEYGDYQEYDYDEYDEYDDYDDEE